MIRIKKGTSKEVILTLTERSRLTTATYTPFYIFQFTDNEGNDVLFTNSDNSTSRIRYNSFTFSNNLGVDKYNGGFTSSEGLYDYSVYESRYNDLVIASASNLLETGIIEIYGATNSPAFISNKDEIKFNY